MDATTRYRTVIVGLFAVALAHALATWPLRETAALFAGGAAVAAVGELAAVHGGLLEHELRPQLAGVPVPVLLAWPATVYVAYRIAALLVPAGAAAAALAALLATAYDVYADPRGVADGVWRYPEHPLSKPRLRGVPWWNFAGWLVVTFTTALLPTLVR